MVVPTYDHRAMLSSVQVMRFRPTTKIKYDIVFIKMHLHSQGRHHLKVRVAEIFIYIYIYNNFKIFICLPFKENLETPSVSFMPIKLNFLHNLFCIQSRNDCLVVYIERDVTYSIDNETIMHRFQNMKTCRRQL